ncbi:hypothetical protein ES703_69946 [subsurface metagenome]
MPSLLKQWKRLSQEDPISKLIRRITRDEIKIALNADAIGVNLTSINNIELDLGLTYFYFPHICDLLGGNWTLESSAGAIYWKTTDAVGEIDKPFFSCAIDFSDDSIFQN